MNPVHLAITLKSEEIHLLQQRAIYRPEYRQLVIADVHLGKATHFRKKGVQMPDQSHLKDMDRISYLLRSLKPVSVMLLGDLFHSDYNREWLWFRSLLLDNEKISFVLVTGNHDILPESAYKIENLKRVDVINEPSFLFTHAPLDKPDKLNICGHVHPGIRITGVARQSFRLPCFYLGKTHFILPAFGHLTGLHIMEKESDAKYFLVTEETIVKM